MRWSAISAEAHKGLPLRTAGGVRCLGIVFGAVIGVIFGNLFKGVRVDEKSSVDIRNYFFDFDIYRRWICSYKSWAGKCRICGCTGNLDYDMFWILPERET